MTIRQVLLAPHEILSPEAHAKQGHFPFLASTKLDGNRCFIHDGELFTRSMKLQPNRFLRQHLARAANYSQLGFSLDGELWSPDLSFSDLQSVIRSNAVEIPTSVCFYAFDLIADGKVSEPFIRRHDRLCSAYKSNAWPNVNVLFQHTVETPEILEDLYEAALAVGCEGLILRSPTAHYKAGRATLRENIIHKMKPFESLDAQIIGFTEQESIRPEAPRHYDERGYLARTSRQDDLVLAGTMGSLQVRDERGRVFNVGWGPGWNHYKRLELWSRRNAILGQWVEVRCMPHGEKNLPRMPQLLRFREPK